MGALLAYAKEFKEGVYLFLSLLKRNSEYPCGFQEVVYPGQYRIDRYRPCVEGKFLRIERWTRDDGDVHWRSISKDNGMLKIGLLDVADTVRAHIKRYSIASPAIRLLFFFVELNSAMRFCCSKNHNCATHYGAMQHISRCHNIEAKARSFYFPLAIIFVMENFMNIGFSIGDVVIIKSGGPAMTVTEVETEIENIIVCTWFTDNKLIQTRRFNKASLKEFSGPH